MAIATALQTIDILAVADDVDRRLYGNRDLGHERKPDLLIGCGDLPAYYLDYLVSRLDIPLYAVHGNHDVAPPLEGSSGFSRCGADWIGGRGIRAGGLLMAGFDGSLRYNSGPYQSSQTEMFAAVRRLVPWMLVNKARYGRYLDILVTHAPPRGIHDEPDVCHTGFDAFNWLIRHFQPRYHLHGHVHIYDRRREMSTMLGQTEIINVYPFRELRLTIPAAP